MGAQGQLQGLLWGQRSGVSSGFRGSGPGPGPRVTPRSGHGVEGSGSRDWGWGLELGLGIRFSSGSVSEVHFGAWSQLWAGGCWVKGLRLGLSVRAWGRRSGSTLCQGLGIRSGLGALGSKFQG